MFTEYDSWEQVPEHLRTKTQLADLDLPRVPGGEKTARVYDRGPHGRRGGFDLYDARASMPSPASARQLEASRFRQTEDSRGCQDCGAHTDGPATPFHDDAREEWVRLCWACLHIARLRQTQHNLAAARCRAAEKAAALLAADTAAVVHVAAIAPPAGENGRPRRPVAAVVEAVTPSGVGLVSMTVRLNQSRSTLIPPDAVPLADALPHLGEVVAGRDLVEWAVGALRPLEDAFAAPDGQNPRRERVTLEREVAVWRGEIDPRTRRPLALIEPGRADRMALLIRRIAADHDPEGN